MAGPCSEALGRGGPWPQRWESGAAQRSRTVSRHGPDSLPRANSPLRQLEKKGNRPGADSVSNVVSGRLVGLASRGRPGDFTKGSGQIDPEVFPYGAEPKVKRVRVRPSGEAWRWVRECLRPSQALIRPCW